MGRFYGKVGYVMQVEKRPGSWVEDVIERNYTGDVIRNVSKWRDGEHLNSNVTLDNRVSIVADPFAYNNFATMRYVEWMGAKWQITSIEVERPRLILTIGGVYNDQTSGTA